MILWSLPILPLGLGSLLWLFGSRTAAEESPRRGPLAAVAAAIMLALLALAVAAAVSAGSTALPWGGGLELTLRVVPMVRVAMVLIPLIALPILLWAAVVETAEGLPRLLGLLVAFTGAMELLVLAADLLVVAIAWELLGALSWVLIAHHWQDATKVAAANYAFNATRLGGLGLWFAAGATLAVRGSFGFDALQAVGDSPWGAWMAAGILAAAASKSAQGPFAPWLFRAMEGPSAVSALLHSSTMVAAGAWLILRLHEPLAAVSWFGPAAIAVGLTTAIAGGFTAIVQSDAKRLLAASTSAQYGLMFVAAGAGYAAAGLAHLVTHAACKALLFLASGTAISVTGSHALTAMRLGRRLPAIAAASWVGALALAAIPPLGAAWSKEKLVAASGHVTPWLAVLTIGAGTLSAWYALRFQTLAFGRDRQGARESRPLAERAGLWLLAGYSLLLGLLWLVGESPVVTRLLPGELPEGQTWELVLSIGAAAAAAVAAWLVYRRPEPTPRPRSLVRELVADWWGLAALVETWLTRPTMALAAFCAAFDRRVVDAGVRFAAALAGFLSGVVVRVLESGIDGVVRGLARGGLAVAHASRALLENAIDTLVDTVGTITGAAGARTRSTQTGAVPTYLAFLLGGFILLFLTFLIGVW